ncbi:hypothetical protein SH2C18_38920 [Clostridium sediminicola]|uniref:hypothetical protein n=1 Tax=Clostridium sediminicola TaxID=3114879 RepID=UPI0031F24F00
MGKKKNCQIQNKNIEPCSAVLGNTDPFIIKNCLIYNNQNRLYLFLRTTPGENCSNDVLLNTNIEISASNFLIGLYLTKIEKKLIKYDKNLKIHSDRNINNFIHRMIQSNNKIKFKSNTFLNAVVSNGNAIQPLINFSIQISNLAYVVVLTLFIVEKNPALFYGSNNFAFNNRINRFLASQNIFIQF